MAELEGDYDELKHIIIRNNQLAAELTLKFSHLVGTADPQHP